MAVELKQRSWWSLGRQGIMRADVRYPWHLWLNGSIWLLQPGVDFDEDILQFQKYAHGYARQWGIKIRTKRTEDKQSALYLQAYQATVKQSARRRRHFRKYEATWLYQHEGLSPHEYVPSPHLRDGEYDGSRWLEEVDDIGEDEDATDDA